MRTRRDRYDSLIEYWSGPEISPKLVKRLIMTESDFNAWAVNPISEARGLMQLKDATAMEVGCLNPFDPEQNIIAGIRYLLIQFDHLWEFNNEPDRWRGALFAYNQGRAWVNLAMYHAYRNEHNEPLPTNYKQGDERLKPGEWQTWKVLANVLTQPSTVIGLRRPNYIEGLRYVEDILPSEIENEILEGRLCG